jgi:hypothetical protein
VTDYDRLHLQYGGRNIKHLVEHPSDDLLERARSELWEELKGPMPTDAQGGGGLADALQGSGELSRSLP